MNVSQRVDVARYPIFFLAPKILRAMSILILCTDFSNESKSDHDSKKKLHHPRNILFEDFQKKNQKKITFLFEDFQKKTREYPVNGVVSPFKHSQSLPPTTRM